MKEYLMLENIIITLQEFICNIQDFYIINTNIYKKKIRTYNLNNIYSYIYINDDTFKNYLNSKVNSHLQVNLNLCNIDNMYIKCDANKIHINASSNIKIKSNNINYIYITDTLVNNITINSCKTLSMVNSTYKRRKINIDKLIYLYLESTELAGDIYLNNINDLHILNSINLINIYMTNITNATILYNYDIIDYDLNDDIVNLTTDYTLLLCNYKKLQNLALYDNAFNTNIILDNLEYLELLNCITIDTIICNNLLYFYCNNNENLKNIKCNSLTTMELVNTYVEEISCNNLNNLSISYNNKIEELQLNNLLNLTLYDVEYIKDIKCNNLLSINLYKCPLIYILSHELLLELCIEECFVLNILCPNLNTATIINCHHLENFISNNLSLLNIKNSSIQNIECDNVESMNINDCIEFYEINNKNLRKLSIINMPNLTKINCKKLEILNITNCNLDNINIVYNNSIVDLTLNDIYMDETKFAYNNLKKLKICNSNIKFLPKYYKNLSSLTLINIIDLKTIDIYNIDTLYLTNCNNIKTINCPNVKTMSIINNTSLKQLVNIPKLNFLTLTNCTSLEKLDVILDQLDHYDITNCTKL